MVFENRLSRPLAAFRFASVYARVRWLLRNGWHSTGPAWIQKRPLRARARTRLARQYNAPRDSSHTLK